MEEIIEGEQASLQNFTWDVLEKSGNKEIGKENIFKAENQTLFDNAMEVTSWKFDPSMKFDLIKQSIETDPSVTPHDFYSKLSTNAKGNPAMSKALSFYKNYDQLMKYKSEDFSAKGFFNPMEALENKMQLKENDIGEFSAFFQLKKAMCDKPDCKLKDIYAAMSGANQGGEFLGMMLGQLGVSATDKNDRMRKLNSVKQYIAGIKNVLLGANPTCYKLLANAELGRSIDQLIAGDEAIEESCKALNDFAFNPHGARVRAVEKSCVSDGPRGHIRPAADKDKESNKKVEGRAR